MISLFLIHKEKAMPKEKYFDINEDGCSVRCKLITAVDAREFKRVIICTHGFGGNKDNANILRFADKETAKFKHDAIIVFDWPCHGADGRKKLTLPECMDYLRLVTKYVKEALHAEYVYNYSVSFGGYLTLKYIKEVENPFTKIALRCPGIPMYELMKKNIASEEGMEKLEKGKEVLIGYGRQMKIDKTLLDDLAASDVRKYEYFDFADSILVLHGTKDTTVPIEYSEKFCDDNVIEFVPIEGADHYFKDPKLMDLAIHRIIEFFTPDD